MIRVGLIVNPIAGMGGRVGLKGTDGEALTLALERGAVPLSGARASACLREMFQCRDAFVLYAGTGKMGEDSARDAGLETVVLSGGAGNVTSSADTVRIARHMLEIGLDLILFAGGDGTARDVCGAVGENAVVLGIPAGVKMHSAVFARSPKEAGRLASDFVTSARVRRALRSSEVMDIDEEAYRNGKIEARLFGYMNVPYAPGRIQGLKSGTPVSEACALEAVAQGALDAIAEKSSRLLFVGAGTTARALSSAMGNEGTLLGVDAWLDGKLTAADAAEADILRLLKTYPRGKAMIAVTPIGGQGFIFGRGSQQFSPEVIRKVGRDGILIMASPGKLESLRGAPMLFDTGDSGLDMELGGYYRVVTGCGQYAMYMARQG
ncbi:MAG: ATP-NAD kinase family protein [Synergistaceae bacterium]|jgi:predicted polyphosphate/ATP-dependent NAD kinase|nr:ATP-NAD kinase family protein [Synergistaceae bacterium]